VCVCVTQTLLVSLSLPLSHSIDLSRSQSSHLFVSGAKQYFWFSVPQDIRSLALIETAH
jgi:hypothetical protein